MDAARLGAAQGPTASASWLNAAGAWPSAISTVSSIPLPLPSLPTRFAAGVRNPAFSFDTASPSRSTPLSRDVRPTNRPAQRFRHKQEKCGTRDRGANSHGHERRVITKMINDQPNGESA